MTTADKTSRQVRFRGAACRHPTSDRTKVSQTPGEQLDELWRSGVGEHRRGEGLDQGGRLQLRELVRLSDPVLDHIWREGAGPPGIGARERRGDRRMATVELECGSTTE